MNHFNSQKCKQCHAQLAIGGKPTAKKGKKCKVCGNINHLNCRTCKHFPLLKSPEWASHVTELFLAKGVTAVRITSKQATMWVWVRFSHCSCILVNFYPSRGKFYQAFLTLFGKGSAEECGNRWLLDNNHLYTIHSMHSPCIM